MAQSRQEIEKALEWARNNNDEAAIRGLERMLNAQAGALPEEGYTPERESVLGAAGSGEQSSVDGTPLSITGGNNSQSVAPNLNARQQRIQELANERPWGEATQGALDRAVSQRDEEKARLWEKADNQYKADQALLSDPKNLPNDEEIVSFLRAKAPQPKMARGLEGLPAPTEKFLLDKYKRDGRQIVKDPATGQVRWAALTPDEIYMEGEKAGPLKTIAKMAGSEAVRMLGRRVESIESGHRAIGLTQAHVFRQLPAHEQDRIKAVIADRLNTDTSKITDDVIQEMSPKLFKQLFDENPENTAVLESLRSGEPGALEKAGQFVRELHTFAYGKEGIRSSKAKRRLKVEPTEDVGETQYEMLDAWEKEAKSGTFGYAYGELIKRSLQPFDPEMEFGRSVQVTADKLRDDALIEAFTQDDSDLQKRYEAHKFVEPGTELSLANAPSIFYQIASGVAKDPYVNIVKAAEQIVNIGPGLAGGWVGGKLATKVLSSPVKRGPRALDYTIRELEKLQKRQAIAGGITGNAVGNAIVFDHAASEVRDNLRQVPNEVWEQNPEVKAFMAQGMTLADARFLITEEAASIAGTAAWWWSSLVTAPTAALSGLGGAGTLLGKSQAARVIAAGAMSPLEEGFQEVVEGLVTDNALHTIDPENPLFKDTGRHAERFAGGFVLGMTGAPLEAASALEVGAPVGIDEKAVKVARQVQAFQEARNKRYSHELKIAHPEYKKKYSGSFRLEALEQLQEFQKREANAIKEMAPTVRAWMTDNPSLDSNADLAMLNSLERFANSTLTDIAVASSQRMTAREMLEQEKALDEERAELQRRVNNNLLDLEEIKRLQNSLTLVQEQEPVTLADLDELVDNEYAKLIGEDERPVLTPKGKRAIKNLGLARLNLESALNAGYTGIDRRQPEALARREQIESLSSEDREKLLYRDAVTGLPNQRAYRERGQSAPAVANIEIDSIEWVNDSMTYAAGDRLISRIVGAIEDAALRLTGRALKEMAGDERDYALYKTAGKELALVGPRQEVIENILQEAAKELASDVITDNTIDITPSMTWGKGDSPVSAEKDLNAARQKRIRDKKIAGRKEKPPQAKDKTKKGGSPRGLFSLDAKEQEIENLANLDVPTTWDDIGTGWGTPERGDIVEILTPGSVQFGTITSVREDSSRPRIEVAIGDRRYRFNPEKNWLINHPMSSAEDLAWLMNDDSLAAYPDKLPQVFEDVQIGLMGKGGDAWYADLSRPQPSQALLPFSKYVASFTDPRQHNLRKSTPEQKDRAEDVANSIRSDYGNAPKFNFIYDVLAFAEANPGLYEQILEEVRASGGTSINGVRGYYDPLQPQEGIYVFVPNVAAASGLDGIAFEQLIMETIYHEMVGHYGVRALFANEQQLRDMMFELVDAFNVGPDNLAKRMEQRLGLWGATSTNFDPARKQLLGEEMVAYVVGLEMSGQLDLSPKQKSILRKIIDWMKAWLNKAFNRVPYTSLTEQRREFWNDERVQDLVSRAIDFTQRGTPYKHSQYEHGRTPLMRDADIFQWNIMQILRTATKKLSKSERKQQVGKYGGDINNVPKEVALFPQEGTFSSYEAIIQQVSKPNNEWGIKPVELTLLGLDPNDSWYLFRDLTYRELRDLHKAASNAAVPRDWYKDVVPYPVGKLLDELYEKAASETSSKDEAHTQIKDILGQPIDAKKTKINYDIFEAHLRSSKAYQIYVEPHHGTFTGGGKRELSLEQAADLLFTGKMHPEGSPNTWVWADGRTGYQDLSEDIKDQIKDFQKLANERGVDIGYNPELDVWVDVSKDFYGGGWAQYSPSGAMTDVDYRNHLAKVKGGDRFDEMPSTNEQESAFHFNSNVWHMRQSVGEFTANQTAKSWKEFDAANQKWANYAYLIVELQADWLAAQRRGFRNVDEMRETDARAKTMFAAIEAGVTHLSISADNLVRDWAVGLIESAIDITPYAPQKTDADNERRRQDLDGSSQLLYSLPYESLDADQQRTVWSGLYNARIEAATAVIARVSAKLDRYLEDNFVAELSDEKLSSMDARAFDALDRWSVSVWLANLNEGITELDLKMNRHSWAQFANEGSLGSELAKIMPSSRWSLPISNGAMLRLPFAKDLLNKALIDVLGGEVASAEQLTQLSNTITSVSQKSFSINKSVLKDIYHATEYKYVWDSRHRSTMYRRRREFAENNPEFVMAQEMFVETVHESLKKATLNNHDDAFQLVQAPLQFRVLTSADNDSINVLVSGSEESIAVFEKYKKAVVDAFFEDAAPRILAQGREIKDANDAYDEVREIRKKISEEWVRSHSLMDELKEQAALYSAFLIDNSLSSSVGREFVELQPLTADLHLQPIERIEELVAEWENHKDNQSDVWRETEDEGMTNILDMLDNERYDAERGVQARKHQEEGAAIFTDALLDDDSINAGVNTEYNEIADEQGQDYANDWLSRRRRDAVVDWTLTEDYANAVRREQIERVKRVIRNNEDRGFTFPYLMRAVIPVAWDDNAAPTEWVNFKVKIDDFGDAAHIFFDDSYEDHYYDIKSGNDVAVARAIGYWYQKKGIEPPLGAFFGPTPELAEELAAARSQDESQPAWSAFAENVGFAEKEASKVDLNKAFREMVQANKKFKKQNVSDVVADERAWFYRAAFWPEDTPMRQDKYWRVHALRYALVDAVRRGFGAIAWQEGLATATRGGHGVGTGDRTAAKRLDWTRETQIIGGKEHDVFLIRLDNRQSIAVTKENAIPVLGLRLWAHLQAVANGDIDANKPIGKKNIHFPFTLKQLEDNEHFIVSETVAPQSGATHYAVWDQLQGRLVGWYGTKEEAQSVIDAEGVDDYTNEVKALIKKRLARWDETGQPRGSAVKAEGGITSGVIFPYDIGAETLYLMLGREMDTYPALHTYEVPTLAGSRISYEQMTLNLWNDELKKYGVQIEDTYIKRTSTPTQTYAQEGQLGQTAVSGTNKFNDDFGAVEVVELTEPTRGYVVMSEKQGMVFEQVYVGIDQATRALDKLRNDYDDKIDDIRVFTIIFNDKIKEAFSKPVAPFQYDPRLEQGLKEARAKIKQRKVSIADRFRKTVKDAKNVWQQKYVDSFHALLLSLKEAGVSLRSYKAARLSQAGLEARVKSALFFGWPTWDENTTGYAGYGLLDVFSMIRGDPAVWGQWMLGLRGKELMLEGYDKLSLDDQAIIDGWVGEFPGETIKDKLWAALTQRALDGVGNVHQQTYPDELFLLTKEENALLGPAGARWAKANAWHFRAASPVYNEDGTENQRLKNGKGLADWEKKLKRKGRVKDMRLNTDPIGEQGVNRLGVHDDPEESSWDRKRRVMIWSLTDDPRVKDAQGRKIHPGRQELMPAQGGGYEMTELYGIETEEEADRIINLVQDILLEKQRLLDEKNEDIRSKVLQRLWKNGREHVFSVEQLVSLIALGDVHPEFERVRQAWNEYRRNLLDFAQEAGVINPETRPFWESEFYLPLNRIQDERLGGFFSASAGIHPEKVIHRLQGGMPTERVAQAIHTILNQGVGNDKDVRRITTPKTYKELVEKGYIKIDDSKKGKKFVNVTAAGRQFLIDSGNNVGDPLDNIMLNLVKMIDAATQNHWKLLAIDDLKESGMIKRTPVATKEELVSGSEIASILSKAGFDPRSLPPGLLSGLQKITVLDPLSEREGYISVFRNGKREYYATDQTMLYESITQVKRLEFMKKYRNSGWRHWAPSKRFYTGAITQAPPFMVSNGFRDTVSASVLGRDEIMPFVDSMQGFLSALRNDETFRQMTAAGATFERGYITGGDTKATERMLKKAKALAPLRRKGTRDIPYLPLDFEDSLVDTTEKLMKVLWRLSLDGYMKLGSSMENASRVALYKAALKSGKSKLDSAYEALDIMDFSMRGTSETLQTLIMITPFLGARIQGLYRTGRGFAERPAATMMKGGIYTMLAISLWAMFRDDERYKELQLWDKQTYHHFWIGDDHYRLPRAFEIGAIFTTIPEMWLEALHSKENDDGKRLLKGWVHMITETFSLGMPQLAAPMVELIFNVNFFTGRKIVSPYDQRMFLDQFGPNTSETMRELAKLMPEGLETLGAGKLRSPKQLENLYRGYTATLGTYLLNISDWLIRQTMDYPLPPTKTPAQHWLGGRWYLGNFPPPRTMQEEEFYRLMEKVTSIQQSVNFYERDGIDDERLDQILDDEAPYINVAKELEDIREDIRELNREEMTILYDENMSPQDKREMIDLIIIDRNALFKEAYELRPGGGFNPIDVTAKRQALIDLIWEWGVNDSELAKKRLKEESPSTMEILTHIRERMERRSLQTLARVSASTQQDQQQ